MLKKTGGGFFLVAILLVGCLFVLGDGFQDNEIDSTTRTKVSGGAFNPGWFDLVLGIDLNGGAELTYELDFSRVTPDARKNLAEDVKKVIADRLNQYGTSERTISVVGQKQILIELPGADDAEIERVRRVIEQAGELTFCLVSPNQQANRIEHIQQQMERYDLELADWIKDQARPAAERRGVVRPNPLIEIVVTDKKNEQKVIVGNTDSTRVLGKWLTGARRTFDDQQLPAIGFTFSNVGKTQFGEMTGENVGATMAIVLDGLALSRATIQSRISGSGILQGVQEDEIAALVPILRAGSLPAKPQLVNQNQIGSVLGEANRVQGYRALGVSFLLVIAFMVVYYMIPGMVANIALLLNMIFLFALMIIFRNVLTFPGMAGLLLTVGMSVDANILIFERIREEKDRGKSLNQAVQAGYQRAFWTIFDANLTTLLTAYILFQFGSGPVKGFAIVLSLGIMVSFFTAVYVSRLILTLLMKRGVLKELKMLQLLKSPAVEFLKFRKPALTTSVAIIAIGLVVLVARGSDVLGIDFTGGTRIVVNLKSQASQEDIRDRISNIRVDGKALFDDVQVQAMGDSGMQFSVRTRMNDTRIKNADAQEGGAQQGDAAAAERQQLQALFTEQVALALGDQLAPKGFGAITFRGGVFQQEWRFERASAPNSQQLETLIRDGGWPLDRVEASTSQGGEYPAFTIYSTQQGADASETRLETDLSHILLGQRIHSTSRPFGEINSISGKVAGDLEQTVLFALLVAIGAIIFYISLRFQFKFGLAAVAALVHDILFVTGVVAIADLALGEWFSLKINLPVVAALLTVIGYSLNDTIVIFDRIRENIADKKRGFDYVKTVNFSINQTLSRTLLTSATTFLVVLILLVFGGEAVEGFAFALCVGVIVGTYSSIFVACPALIHFNERSEQRRETLLKEAAAK